MTYPSIEPAKRAPESYASATRPTPYNEPDQAKFAKSIGNLLTSSTVWILNNRAAVASQ